MTRPFLLSLVLCTGLATGSDRRPDVLFIAVDDLNDWIGCLGGHPQSVTPNFDRLAASGVLFTNAHCAAPACNPSRTAIFTGRSPHRSGLYANGQPMREVLPDATLLPQYFRDHGYRAAGSGKMLHYFIDAQSWDDYFPAKETEDPLPFTKYPDTRPLNLPRGGPWQYVETDWGPLYVTDKEFGGDYRVSEWIGERLADPGEKPLFLACGLYRPHEPWFVPKKYFDRFPLESVQLPPGYKADDQDDLPPGGLSAVNPRYLDHIRAEGQWRQGVQGYLASIAFADAMLGRVLDAVDRSPRAENTIVVLWSDHGWHLGEKQHWQKYTAWRRATRVPLMVRVPPGVSDALPDGTTAGTVCDQPASLLSLYPTLLELCGLPAKADNDGASLTPLLRNAEAEWPHVALTFRHVVGSCSVSSRTHRYITYPEADGKPGGEELYDVRADPYEWTNLAGDPAQAENIASLRRHVPTDFAPKPEASIESLTLLPFHPAADGSAPQSKPVGSAFPVYFENTREEPVELCWMPPATDSDATPTPKSYGVLKPGKRRKMRLRPGAVWLIRDAASGRDLGHFVVDDRTARAIVP